MPIVKHTRLWPSMLFLACAAIALLSLVVWLGGCAKPGTSRENAVQTPDHTGLTWFDPPTKGAR